MEGEPGNQLTWKMADKIEIGSIVFVGGEKNCFTKVSQPPQLLGNITSPCVHKKLKTDNILHISVIQ